ncbi:hypothetical protein ACFE04_001067 [Oxalis oulophora]
MSQRNQGMGSPSPGTADIPMKRKRGRPRKDDIIFQLDNKPAHSESDSFKKSKQTEDSYDSAADNQMVGQVVSGVIEGSFDAGYLLKVHVGDTDTHLRGVVFLPGKFSPITEVNDIAPNVKMHKRKEIPDPASKLPQSDQTSAPLSESSDKQHVETECYIPELPDQVQSIKPEFTPEVVAPVAGETQSVADVVPPANNLLINETLSAVSEVAPPQQVIEAATENQVAPVQSESNFQNAVEQEGEKQETGAPAVVEGFKLNTDMGIIKELELMPGPSVDTFQGSKFFNHEPPAAHMAFSFALKPNELLCDEVKGTDLDQQSLFAEPASKSPENFGTENPMEKQMTSIENTPQRTDLNLCSTFTNGQWPGMPLTDACNNGVHVLDSAMTSEIPMTSLLASSFNGEDISSEVKVGPEAPPLPSMIDNQICSSTDNTENRDCMMTLTDEIPPAQS